MELQTTGPTADHYCKDQNDHGHNRFCAVGRVRKGFIKIVSSPLFTAVCENGA